MTLERADVEEAIAVLVANFRTTVADDLVDVWGSSLAEFDRATLLACVRSWNAYHPRFPTLAEIHAECRTYRHEHDNRPRTCGICDGTGWCAPTEGEGHGGLVPCPTCNPALATLLADGHMAPDHDQRSCGHCVDTKKATPMPPRATHRAGAGVTKERAAEWSRVIAALPAAIAAPRGADDDGSPIPSPRHDHTARATVIIDGEVRPMWHITCPRCGSRAVTPIIADLFDGIGAEPPTPPVVVTDDTFDPYAEAF